MRKRKGLHVPVFVWVFLTGLFFTNFTCDRAYSNAPDATLKMPFEVFADSLYNTGNFDRYDLSRSVFEKAVTGYFNIKLADSTKLKKSLVTIVDFTRRSTDHRLWVIDLAHDKVLFYTLVAHGKNTGEQYASFFSNQMSSNMSSLGFYLTAEIYNGKHGESMALDGLEPGFNDNARERAVVMHAADYVSEDYADHIGRIGRSWGCPALPPELAPAIINTIAQGSCLFLYYPDKTYEKETAYYNRESAEAAFEKNNAAKSVNP